MSDLTTVGYIKELVEQTDDIQRNYTVAKATMDCDFQGLLIQDTKIKVDSYNNNILDEFGSLIYEPIINTSVNELFVTDVIE